MEIEGSGPRIGIYSGAFNPVHAGHLGFALVALESANLDEIYFMPERLPREKPGVEHYGHRVAMLKRALKPHNSLSVIELADKQLTVHRTMPQLRRVFPSSRLVFLMGTDVFAGLPDWQNVDKLVREAEFIVSVRSSLELSLVLKAAQYLELTKGSLHIVDSIRPELSSSRIRDAIRFNMPTQGLLPSVYRYARQEWLYTQLPR